MNEIVRQLYEVGIIAERAVIGKPMLINSYHVAGNAAGRCQVWHSTLLLPDGAGALDWDHDEYVDLSQDYEPTMTEACGHFVPFADCPSVPKALAADQIDRLFREVLATVWLQRCCLKPLLRAK